MVILLLSFGAFAPAAMAQTWPRCSSGCTTSAVTVTNVWLDVHGCTGETGTATADVYVEFYNSRQAAVYCIVFVTDLYVDGDPYEDNLSYYFIPSIAGSGYHPQMVGTIDWPCGSKLQLKDVLVEWQTTDKTCGENCTNYNNAHCDYQEVGPTVKPPVISVTQSSDYPCPNQDVVITAHVTDEDGTVVSVNLTYDGSSVAMNGIGDDDWQATILGQSDGTTLTITVTAEDNDGNKVTTPPHDKTWSGPDCTITAPSPVCAYSTGNTASVADAGEGTIYSWTIIGGTITSIEPYTYSINWDAGAPGTATIGVTVTSTYGCSCTNSIDVTLEDCSTDLSIIKSDDPDPVGVGALLTYTLTVTNNGPGYATGVVVTDTLPGCLTNANYSIDGGSDWYSYDSGSDISLGDIPNGNSKTVLIRGNADCYAACTITNTATVSSDTDDPNLDNNSASEETAMSYTATFTIVKSVNDAAPVVGDTVTYTYTFTNIGDVTLSGVTVTDSNLGTVMMSPTTLDPAGGTSTVATGTLTLDITEANLCLPITNTADAYATDPCNVQLMTKTSNEITVTPGYGADFTIVKSADKTSATVGTVIGYNITVNNTGNVNLSNVLVTDNLTGLSQTITTLVPNASQTFNPSYTVTQADICAPINNTATANGTDPCGGAVGPESASVSVPTTFSPSLEITKTANVSSATVGTVIGYNITVNNTGNVNLTNVLVTDSLTGLSQTIPSLVPNASQTFNPT
jgi:uncharacterized repeat protein (TIGR01451 family)